MSANNYILIKQTKRGNYAMNERDADTHKILTHFGLFIILRDAIKVANEYMKKNEVEYGIDIRLLK